MGPNRVAAILREIVDIDRLVRAVMYKEFHRLGLLSFPFAIVKDEIGIQLRPSGAPDYFGPI